MISVNFQSYNKYVTDSLYQWDLNRKLVINGLNISIAPVIVFANRHIDRGIVVQSKLDDGVITCDVPNALLQFPCPITASLCNVSDQEYKAFETVFIPVIARVMPADYLYSDNIPILTYESIKADLDVSLTELERVTASKADLDTERGRIDTLSARLDQAIAPGGVGVFEEYDVDMSREVSGSVKIKTNGVHAIVDFNTVIPSDLENFSKNVPYTVGTIPSYCLPFEDKVTFEFEKYKIEVVNWDGDQLIKVTWLVDISPMNPTSAFVNNSVCYALANIWVDEIVDLRIGSDGTRYNSAGEAVRVQCGNALKELEKYNNLETKNIIKVQVESQIINDLTMEVKSDKTLVFNGTPSATTVIDVTRLNLLAEPLILSGCPSGGSGSKYKLDIINVNSASYQYADYGNKLEVTPEPGEYRVRIVIYKGVKCENLTFKPMLSRDDVPYEQYTGDILSKLNALEARLSKFESQTLEVIEE